VPNNYHNLNNPRKIKLNPIYDITNKKATINNRYDNNTINFSDISEIKYKNEQDMSNISEKKNKKYLIKKI